MPELDDHELLASYARGESEAAFATLVARYVNLVYSAALRFTGNPHHAQEITQAVFIVLARKAGSLRRGTVLSGWLYQTARLTAANFVKGEIRRQRREQEVYMQSTLNEPDAVAWEQIAPLLDEAMGRLGETDRNAVVLRFFENKTAQEVGAALKLTEAAAHKRVNRALEKLRKIFSKRGVTLTTTLIVGAVSANSVQAAPVGLAATIAFMTTKGAALGGSTLALVKGALNLMALAKAKTAIVVGVGVLLAAGTTTVVVEKVITHAHSILEQRLDDGSLLILNGVSFGDTHEFSHGGKKTRWGWPGHEELVAEFKVVTRNAEDNPLMKDSFFRQYRCVLRGERGIEYVEEFEPERFKADSGAYYGYVRASSFPRDSRWLWFRIEKREDSKRYDLWQKVAEFKVLNPTRPANLDWVARPTPATNTVAGMNFVLGEITVKTIPNYTNDIWNHVVTVPTEVWGDGLLLTNWSPTYVQARDASGNWLSLVGRHMSLDPRYVWKLDMDFEPQSGFPLESIATVDLPEASSEITTNFMNMPVTIAWDGHWINANMPTNRPDLALKFVYVTDDQGENISQASGSWNQYFFRKGSFYSRKGNVLTEAGKLETVTFAIVPNVHTTFYVQPRLVADRAKN